MKKIIAVFLLCLVVRIGFSQDDKQKVERLNERFLAHTYNTLTKLYKIVNL